MIVTSVILFGQSNLTQIRKILTFNCNDEKDILSSIETYLFQEMSYI